MKCLVIMNHKLTEEQVEDLKKNHGVTEIKEMPEELKKLWKEIDPEADHKEVFEKTVRPVDNWIISEMIIKDKVKRLVCVIAGEPLAAYQLVRYQNQTENVCLSATTKRVSEERKTESGVEKINIFKHVRFRQFSLP